MQQKIPECSDGGFQMLRCCVWANDLACHVAAFPLSLLKIACVKGTAKEGVREFSLASLCQMFRLAGICLFESEIEITLGQKCSF